MHDQRTPSARDQIAEAAVELIGDADAGDLLRALTPERLAEASGRSASTVRYHFGGQDAGGAGTYAFQRRDLALTILGAALEARVTTTEASTRSYEQAVAGLAEADDLSGIHDAIAEHLAPFLPGPSGATAAAGERILHLGLAMCDTDATAARMLRDARARQVEALIPIVRIALSAVGREPAPDRSVGQLADAMLSILDGHLLRLRFDPGTPADGINAAVVAIFATFSRPRGGEAFDPAAELLGR